MLFAPEFQGNRNLTQPLTNEFFRSVRLQIVLKDTQVSLRMAVRVNLR